MDQNLKELLSNAANITRNLEQQNFQLSADVQGILHGISPGLEGLLSENQIARQLANRKLVCPV